MSGKDEDDGFLSRWSRRKRAAAAEEEPAANLEIEPEDATFAEANDTIALSPAENQDIGALAGEPDPDETLSAEEIEALPPLDTVTSREELQLFLRKGVPKALRQAALRKVWMMNPKISGYLDVARDYAYDWNVAGGVPGNSGTLSPSEALRMVDKFLQRKPEETNDLPERDSPPAIAETSAEEMETTAEFSQPDIDADTVTDNPQDTTLVADLGQGETDGTASTGLAAPIKRHGGAIPR